MHRKHEAPPTESPTPDKPRKPLVNLRWVLQRTGLPKGTLYSKISRGEIPVVRLGPRLPMFDPDEVEAWIDSCRVGGKGTK